MSLAGKRSLGLFIVGLVAALALRAPVYSHEAHVTTSSVESARIVTAQATPDSVWVVINPIKADKRADYEEWAKEFWAAGTHSSDGLVRRRFADAHVVVPSAPSADGSWPYVIVLHPYHPGEDYIVASLTRQLVPAADTARLNALLAGARARPGTIIKGTMLPQ